MGIKRVQFTIEPDVLKDIDEECKILGITRSAFITMSCKSQIAERKTIELLQSNKDVYKDAILKIADGLK